MRTCWAAALGHCRGKITREHPLSEGLIGGGPVAIQGGVWPEDRTLPASAITRKVLCERHNSLLGEEVDPGGIDAFRTIEKFLTVRSMRIAENQKQMRRVHHRVQGLLLERFLLKSLIGLQYRLATPDEENWLPPMYWIEVAFGRRPMKAGHGLHVGPLPNPALVKTNRLMIDGQTVAGDCVDGAIFRINGWDWALVMAHPASPGPDFEFRPSYVKDRGRGLFQGLRLVWN